MTKQFTGRARRGAKQLRRCGNLPTRCNEHVEKLCHHNKVVGFLFGLLPKRGCAAVDQPAKRARRHKPIDEYWFTQLDG